MRFEADTLAARQVGLRSINGLLSAGQPDLDRCRADNNLRGVQMLSARKYSIALLAAIPALMPFSSLCCVLGVPIGIWAIIVLRNPEVRAAFQNSQMPTQ
jgi:hypothetical protein